MRAPAFLAIGLFLTLWGAASPLVAQAPVARQTFPLWEAELPSTATVADHSTLQQRSLARASAAATHSQAEKGLLVGGVLGAVATTFFLVNFCGGSDTSCDLGSVATATMVIGFPVAAVGALIGALTPADD